jgi:DNA-binding beta-propeller fold protein YncE
VTIYTTHIPNYFVPPRFPSVFSPTGVAVAPDGSKVYVEVFALDTRVNDVLVIDTTTNVVSTAIPLDTNAIGAWR